MREVGAVTILRLCPLLLVLVVSYGCTAKSTVSPKTSSLPRAEVKSEGISLRFELQNYVEAGQPSFQLVGRSSVDWVSGLGSVERNGETVSVTLNKGLRWAIVEDFSYTWTLPDRQVVTGTAQYRDPRFADLDWKRTKIGRFTFYHIGPYSQHQAEFWEEKFSTVERWTGIKLPDRYSTIWIFPSRQLLKEYRGQSEYGFTPLLINTDTDIHPLEEISLTRELIFTVGHHKVPSWVSQGLGRYLTGVDEVTANKYMLETPDTEIRLALLHESAQRRMIDPATSDYQKESYLEPDAIGLSIYLYIERHYGEAAIMGLHHDVETLGVEGALKKISGKPLPQLWAEWNAYIRSPHMLQDWRKHTSLSGREEQ
jgi:hypothetical protein